MVSRYVKALTEYQELQQYCDGLSRQMHDTQSHLLVSRQLMQDALREAIRERILGDIKASPEGRIEFRRLKTAYCSADMFNIDGEDVPRLTRRGLLGYIDELVQRGEVHKSDEYADGQRILALYASKETLLI